MQDLWCTKWHWDRSLSKDFGFSVNIIPPTPPYSSSSTFCSYQMDKKAKPGNVPKSNALMEIEEHWTRKYLHSTTGNCNCNCNFVFHKFHWEYNHEDVEMAT